MEEVVNVRGIVFTDGDNDKAYKVVKEDGEWVVKSLAPEALSVVLSAVTDDSIDLFGKKASDFQQNMVIGESDISGQVKFVRDFTAFSSKVEEQSGWYIALKAVANKDGAVLKMNNVALDADGIQIVRVPDKSKKVKVEAILGDEHITKLFTLQDLDLEVEE